MRISQDPELLAASLPDIPRWIETRSLLLSGDATLRIAQRHDGAIVMDTDFPSGSVVGRADIALLREVLADVPADFELNVQMDALNDAQQALPRWAVAEVIVHAPAQPYPSSGPAELGVVVSAPPDDRFLEPLPDDVRRYAAVAEAVAVRVVGGKAVAVCAASDVTETLWDVGIDTLEGHRRCGYATACFRALAIWMASRRRQPVWAAYEEYPPSVELAKKLGFQPVDRIAVLSPRPAP